MLLFLWGLDFLLFFPSWRNLEVFSCGFFNQFILWVCLPLLFLLYTETKWSNHKRIEGPNYSLTHLSIIQQVHLMLALCVTVFLLPSSPHKTEKLPVVNKPSLLWWHLQQLCLDVRCLKKNTVYNYVKDIGKSFI